MISPYEIIQLINRQFGTTASDTIEEINELIQTINNDPKSFVYELSKELQEFSEKLGLCPLCGGKVVQLKSDYQPSEYFGQPVNEQINIYGCETENCGYIKH